MATRKKKQQTEVDEHPLDKFTCRSCGFTGFDTEKYFGKPASIRCLWCIKYPKKSTPERYVNADGVNAAD